MKRKGVAIFLSIVLIVTLLMPSTLVKAETNGREVQQTNEAQIIEEAIDPNRYDPILYKIVLYTLQKTTEDSITINELESIKKIDVEELQKEHSDLSNITISSFSLLKNVVNLEELNLGNSGWNTLNLSDNSWDGIESLSKLSKLGKLKINGCTFIAIQPETTISKELLSKLKIVNDITENAQLGDKILEIQLGNFTVSEDNKVFTIPNINEMKSMNELDDADKPNALSSEVVSNYECSINNYQVSFNEDTFEESQFPVEIKLSSNRIKAIIKINILVDESLLKNENKEDNGGISNPTEDEEEPNKNMPPVINASDKAIKVGEEFNPLEGVTATDEEDGDITSKIEVNNKVDINTVGQYEVIYSVKDSNGEEATKTIYVTVQRGEGAINTAPVINAENKIIELGSKFDALEGITATDAEDGDISNRIRVVSSNVDVNNEGVYVVTYEVEDKDGASVRKNIEITVIKAITEKNEPPVINASDRTIKVGDKFNPYSGVTASDYEDGDITDKLKVIYNNLNTNVIGLYRIIYEVTDSGGYRVTKGICVNVISKSNTRPIIYVDDVIVPLGSRYNPYAMVSAYDKEDGNITGSVIVVYNYVNVYKEGTYKVGYKVTDSMGKSASCVIKVTVKNYYGIEDTNKNSNPVIYANDISVALNSKFNPLEWVAATDKEDGDITNRVMVIVNDVDTSVEGNYHVTYEVVDSNGNKVNKAMMVYVKAASVVKEENTAPVINAEDLTIEKGVYFDPLDGVTALDEKDGNLTHKIVVKENEVNVSKAGAYKVSYQVIDSMGEKTSKSIKVTVEGSSKIVNYELFEMIGGVLIIILLAGSVVAIVVTRKKQ